MPVPQDDIEFGARSKRYRRKGSGKFLSGGPRDFDDGVGRFRAKNGRFKDQSAYGADNVRDNDKDREFVGTSAPSTSKRSMDISIPSVGTGAPEIDLDTFEPDTSVDDDLELRFGGL